MALSAEVETVKQVGRDSCEYKIVRENFTKIVEVASTNLPVLAAELFSKYLLNSYQYQRILDGVSPSYSRASEAIMITLELIEADSSKYYQFLDVLRNIGAFQDLTEHLRRALSTGSFSIQQHDIPGKSVFALLYNLVYCGSWN